MCLAIPMQVIEVDGDRARCQCKGIERDVNLFLLQHEPVQPGEYVMVHVGYAIQKVNAQDARTAWDLFEQLQAAEPGPDA